MASKKRDIPFSHLELSENCMENQELFLRMSILILGETDVDSA